MDNTALINSLILNPFTIIPNWNSIDSMIDEKADQWVLSASLKDKVIQIKWDDINIALEYKDIFLNRYFAQWSKLKLINFCWWNKNTLDALNSAQKAQLKSNTKFWFEEVEFETSQHLWSGTNDLTTLKSEFLSSLNQNFNILNNDCFKDLKDKFKIKENNLGLTTIKEFTSFNTTSKVIEITKIRYNDNNPDQLNRIPGNFTLALSKN